MQVILLEKIRNVGDLGDTVNVKSGFGRNYLIPQGKAVFATQKNVELFEQRRSELEEKARKKLEEAQAVAKKLSSLTVHIDALSSDEGKLYGSIGPLEVAKAITDAGVSVSRSDVVMPLGAIHEVGIHMIDIQLHSDVNLEMSISVGQFDSEETHTDSEEVNTSEEE